MASVNYYAEVYSTPYPANYVSIGHIDTSDTVSVLWKENPYFYIQYWSDDYGKYKCGYVLQGAVDMSPASVINRPFTSQDGDRYVNTTATTYYGRGSNYVPAGYVTRGETVYYLGYKYGGYAFIRYDVPGNKKKNAFIYANYLSTSPPVD